MVDTGFSTVTGIWDSGIVEAGDVSEMEFSGIMGFGVVEVC